MGGGAGCPVEPSSAGCSNIYFGDVHSPAGIRFLPHIPNIVGAPQSQTRTAKILSLREVKGRQEGHRHTRKPLHKQLLLG